ncbi:T9SS C-terminal target domain-containing protein [Echinicola jeungdonensis]|uniref:T9SS C-terminal target domain-containing protein n=2 Tax=Echinicola jeungdonensis TaxID=709343 RepID=A0ABV5J235_9BACT
MYEIISVILITGGIISAPCDAQTVNAYRTVSSGYFDAVEIWEIYNGSDWVAASKKPDKDYDIYIENAHLVTLRQDEEVKSLYLNAAIGADQKININGWELHIYGSLNAFEGDAPGTSRGAWNTNNWIGNSLGSKIVFKGDSRTIIEEGAWSGFSINSTYSVVFDGGVGTEFVINEPFKANKFTIKSGTVVQNWMEEKGCSTLSFNSNDDFGEGAYGDLVVEDGATLETKCSEGITFRSSTQPSSLFEIEEGGNLVLKGNQPEINAATISLEGNVFYQGESGNQQFITSELAGSGEVETYRNLFFSGAAIKELPSTLEVKGDFEKLGGGSVQQNNTTLIFSGNEDQNVSNWAMEVDELEIDKSAGEIRVDNDITVIDNFLMNKGSLDLSNNNLFFNTSGLGSYQYTGGTWLNLAEVHYENIPSILNAENATFPFIDQKEGGIRKLQLVGNHSASNPDITIQYHEAKGVNQDPGFQDDDGTPILYQLNSYFTFSGTMAGTEDLELKISADNLIVEDADDLRIVGNQEAAPGMHLPGEMVGGEAWSKREVSFDELNGNDFTIGSYRVATILPVYWLNYRANQSEKGNLIFWEIGGKDRLKLFYLYRSLGGIDHFEKIGKVNPKVNQVKQDYSFLDGGIINGELAYYQIEILKKDGKRIFSPVFKLEQNQNFQFTGLAIGPNPYSGGNLYLNVSKKWLKHEFKIHLQDCQGTFIAQFRGKGKLIFQDLKNTLKEQSAGLYFISFIHPSGIQVLKWVKQ